MVKIWNEVVEDGVAFPQEKYLTDETGREFFAAQTYTAVAEDADTGRVLGLYILHPNNVGRCGHICNASYAVERTARGLHIGEKLVKDCLAEGARHGALGYCSSTPSLPQTHMQGIFMRGSDLWGLASFPAVFA